MGDWLSPEQRSRNMSAIRASGTKPEVALGRAIKTALPRRRIVSKADLPGRPDFFLPAIRMAVFADGCFWHGCPAHGRRPADNADYWVPKLKRNRRRDRLVTQDLRELGVVVVRVWEHDLKRDVGPVVSRLRRTGSRAAGTVGSRRDQERRSARLPSSPSSPRLPE